MNKFRLFATLMVVALCATTIFTSCRNDDDDNAGFEIRATNIANLPAEIRAQIETVKAEIDGYIIGEAPFGNSFRLQLRSVPQRFLEPIFGNVRGFEIDAFYAFDRNGNVLGYFFLGDIPERYGETWEAFQAIWLYVDRDATIRDEDEDGLIMHLDLRRGWNTVYVHVTYDEGQGKDRFTSQRPAGANLRWYFESWDESWWD